MDSDNESIASVPSVFDLFHTDWNPMTKIRDYDLHSAGPETWKIIQEEEFQKITSLSTDQLFDYIKYVVRADFWTIGRYYSAVYNSSLMFGSSGPDAATEFENTMISIVMKLKNRLEEELQIFDDIQNVREVMVGNISLSEHTAMFCVYNHMVRISKRIRASKIRRYIAKVSFCIKEIKSIFEIHYFELEQEELRERLQARRRRKRRAPERLNITSTKQKSYL